MMSEFERGFHEELKKIADLKEEAQLRSHQIDSINFIRENDGRALLAHATGSGKTLSAIAAAEDLRARGKANNVLVLTPASLQTNFTERGVQKFTNSSVGPVGSGSDYQLMSIEKFRKDPDKALADSKADTLIIDEIHRAKEQGTKTYKALRDASLKVDNVIGLTGSFISNHPRELVPLMDIVHPQHELGSPKNFGKKYTKAKMYQKGFLQPQVRKIHLKNQPRLRGHLQGVLSYLGHDDVSQEMPKLDMQDVHVPMSDEQNELYQFSLRRLNPAIRAKIRHGLPPNQSEASHILGVIQKARQAANSIGTHSDMNPGAAAEATPKLKKVMDDVQTHLQVNPEGQAVVYSNLVFGGARELYDGLSQRGLNPGIYAGAQAIPGITNKTRDQDVRDFQAGNKNVMIVTPAGGEGLSFDNATFFGAVDHHYNPERNWQAIARARRIGGQTQRPPEKRVLEVKRYYSDPKPSPFSRIFRRREIGVDEWIQQIANEKDRLNLEMRKTVQDE
jgi:SNF2 family DNA or RNA helicase